ncbi:MAG TPA: glycine--tRNA ligase subunit beta [Stellaceae bacterium]|nr:glycine--tRNA ligase subunit beta [Stellaceae bacterium]
MADLLFELLTEEIPARMQARAAEDLARSFTKELAAIGLACTEVASYATPRRLTLAASGLPDRQPDRADEVKGPRVGAPDQAIQGFLRSAGLASIEACEIRDTGKGGVYFAVKRVAGAAIEQVLPGVLRQVIDTLSWPKSMRWADHDFRWVRPLRNILAIIDRNGASSVIDLRFPLKRDDQDACLIANDRTTGHRFMSSGEVAVTGFEDYRARLRERFVILDASERRAKIQADATAAAAGQGLTVKDDPGLLEEVTGLVEWPVTYLGRIDPTFMTLPPEVLTTSMRSHQKYFACLDAAGVVAPAFIVIANRTTTDGGKQVVAGNERVLRARLSDAMFFWDQDRKAKLESRVGRLKERIFHAKLGTVYDKVERMATLVEVLAQMVPNADLALARRAVLLAKADLSSALVGEFPELQGIMGRYLALHDGEAPEVAEAIAQHYAPLGPSDTVPTTPVSILVSLADKIDTLAGFFAIDERPTGSKDPYALRRACLGIIRVILENKSRLPLRPVFDQALGTLADRVPDLAARRAGLVDGLMEFVADRLKVFMREQGVRHDLVAAVFSLGDEDDLVRLLARTRALADFLATDDGANLLIAYRRASKIVLIEEKKDAVAYRGEADPQFLRLPEETALSIRLAEVGLLSDKALRQEDFTRAMSALATLRRPIDEFFDRVTVNIDDPALRANRLRLLAKIWGTLNQVADFSTIEG